MGWRVDICLERRGREGRGMCAGHMRRVEAARRLWERLDGGWDGGLWGPGKWHDTLFQRLRGAHDGGKGKRSGLELRVDY